MKIKHIISLGLVGLTSITKAATMVDTESFSGAASQIVAFTPSSTDLA